MKKVLLVLSVLGLFVLAGCKPNVTPGSKVPEAKPPVERVKEEHTLENVEPVIINEVRDIDETLPDGVTVDSVQTYKGTPVLKVTPTNKGLRIERYHTTDWVWNSIHVYDVTDGIENVSLSIDDSDGVWTGSGFGAKDWKQRTTVYTYPFVKKGHEYKVYLVHMNSSWGDWGSTDNTNGSVTVQAIGGYGNYNFNYESYYYDVNKYTLTLKNLKITWPDVDTNMKREYSGTFYVTAWQDPTEAAKITTDKSQFKFSGNSSFLKGKKSLFLSMEGSSEYKDNTYKISVISTYIYQYIEGERNLLLEAKGQIPNVYITSSDGYESDSTYHFGDDWKPASMKIVDINNEENNLAEVSIQIKDRGNSTKWTGKTPFSIKMDKKNKVLGMKKHKRWVLMANYLDRTMVRTRFAGYLGNNVFNSSWNSKFTPVNLYVNERFIGTYDIGEHIKIGDNRVEVQSVEDYVKDPSKIEDVNGDGVLDINDTGFILEIDMRNKQKYHFYSEYYKLALNLKDPDFDSDTEFDEQRLQEALAYVQSKINAFDVALSKPDFKQTYKNYIDVDSFIDWYFVNEFSKNYDSLFQTSVYMYYDPSDGKIRMGPNWDFDLAFGNCNWAIDSNGEGVNVPTGWYVHGGKKDIGDDNQELVDYALQLNNDKYYHAYWINRLFEDPAFKKAVKNRWMNQRIYLKNAINEKIVEYADEIYGYIPANEEINPRIGKESWNGPDGWETRVEYEEEIDYLYNWCMTRYKWMNSQISAW